MATVARPKSRLVNLAGFSWQAFEALVTSLTESRPSLAYSDGTLTVDEVIRNVSWEEYERLLDALPNDRLPHVYLRGDLRLMSPLRNHDRIKKLVARLLEATAFELNIDVDSNGSTTLRSKHITVGLEPDEVYYIKNAEAVREDRELDLSIDPPPDSILEIDVTHVSKHKLPVYVLFGVPEVWWLKRGKIEFLKLNRRSREYVPTPRSLSFPMITSNLINEHLAMKKASLPENQIVRSFLNRIASK